MHEKMAATLDQVVAEIQRIQAEARSGVRERPAWPMIILRSPKGWTCPKEIDGKKTEDYWRSHQVPMGEMHGNPEHVRILEQWLKSYRPEELFDDAGSAERRAGYARARGRAQDERQSSCQWRPVAQRPDNAGFPGLCGSKSRRPDRSTLNRRGSWAECCEM
jgi:phosphoketolase